MDNIINKINEDHKLISEKMNSIINKPSVFAVEAIIILEEFIELITRHCAYEENILVKYNVCQKIVKTMTDSHETLLLHLTNLYKEFISSSYCEHRFRHIMVDIKLLLNRHQETEDMGMYKHLTR